MQLQGSVPQAEGQKLYFRPCEDWGEQSTAQYYRNWALGRLAREIPTVFPRK